MKMIKYQSFISKEFENKNENEYKNIISDILRFYQNYYC